MAREQRAATAARRRRNAAQRAAPWAPLPLPRLAQQRVFHPKRLTLLPGAPGAALALGPRGDLWRPGDTGCWRTFRFLLMADAMFAAAVWGLRPTTGCAGGGRWARLLPRLGAAAGAVRGPEEQVCCWLKRPGRGGARRPRHGSSAQAEAPQALHCAGTRPGPVACGCGVQRVGLYAAERSSWMRTGARAAVAAAAAIAAASAAAVQAPGKPHLPSGSSPLLFHHHRACTRRRGKLVVVVERVVEHPLNTRSSRGLLHLWL